MLMLRAAFRTASSPSLSLAHKLTPGSSSQHVSLRSFSWREVAGSCHDDSPLIDQGLSHMHLEFGRAASKETL